MRGRHPLIAVAVLLSGCATGTPAPSPGPIGVVPVPSSVRPGVGEHVLSGATTVAAAAQLAEVTARQVAALRRVTGLPLEEADARAATLRVEHDASQPEEGYELEVSADGVRIAASAPAGAFYAFQTLRQLLPPEVESAERAPGVEWRLPVVVIRDAPRFSWRGLHLDTARRFFDVETVKRYVDLMSRFKLNRFHWHLTEDQGWRVEIDAYPRLMEVGAWRAESPTWSRDDDDSVMDGVRHGGYYTKEQMREVVEYAAERFVTVIPEIELPGHATAAIASYPELGCTGEQLEVTTTWGIFESIFCPSEETFAFLETVLDEVMEIFPSPWIHIGGDEVPKKQWEESSLAQQVIEREGLTDEEELQSWFIRRIERHLSANGRRLIGWDEILEGGLAPNATVMSWRGTEGGIAAARQGHDVIMTPVEHAYFDFYQAGPEGEPPGANWSGSILPLDRVYAFEPVPEELTAEQAEHILGAQGNLWSEHVPTREHLDYMVYPRALAMAEVAWSPKEARDWEGFVARLPAVLRHLDELGVSYRRPAEHLATAAAGSD
ncbi:MAG TPA: beta-N-acetylhexosaminidase [Thermoanaerobaculia bacterium]|nr:beta-N-acetylhexosaminidase [Thermoanaerobaculia bacterium]